MSLTQGDIKHGLHRLFLAVALLLSVTSRGQMIIDSSEISLIPGALLVSEVLFNPEPGGADYVELYNATNDTLWLESVSFVRWYGESMHKLYPFPADSYVCAHDYAVFTTNAAFVRNRYDVRHPDKLWEMELMPALPNTSGTVMVVMPDSTILDRFDYSETLHSRILRNVEGVALERRNFFVDAQDPDNWHSAASNTGGGTPTYKNSTALEFLFLENDFLIHPSTFSPDGDGYDDQLDITYQLTDVGLVGSITLFDAAGRLVRHLLRNGVLGFEGVEHWDGLDDDHRPCPRGSYVVLIEVFDDKGMRQSAKRACALVRQ